MWAGTGAPVPDPCIIVRLLLTRPAAQGRQFFSVPTPRGLDLPTEPLGRQPGGTSVADGLSALTSRTLGRADLELACVGFVRNVVPVPDADYPHPTPWAHVPVFEPASTVEPVIEGSWLTLDAARHDLATRHWWPIVERHLAART